VLRRAELLALAETGPLAFAGSRGGLAQEFVEEFFNHFVNILWESSVIGVRAQIR
jgi:hypothetical protein